ncbi:uncharacterized protein LOC115643929 isoform X2 [Gopherus evgoodei]|uniref:uncharacterized protein LOC115643929 isoform X2 n=1 Tax=Gopherus evgoodei TaxID=1825980 RepID=UPI0011CF849C|nr:uncharacterized protein LOC115643929 isoform X2 [Gopherus evgoodei]
MTAVSGRRGEDRGVPAGRCGVYLRRSSLSVPRDSSHCRRGRRGPGRAPQLRLAHVARFPRRPTAGLLEQRACEFVTKFPSIPISQQHLEPVRGTNGSLCLDFHPPGGAERGEHRQGADQLASLGGLSRPTQECLDHALLTFSREVGYLQEKTRLVIHCEGQELVFFSGQGKNNIEVSYIQGVPHY